MKKQTIETHSLRTLDWFDGALVDWNSAGTQYSLDGATKKLQKYHFGFVCDGSITSENGTYALIYQKLGTKGLLLKNGEILREINRSYYQSSAYEFPAAFLNYKNRTYLVHCPTEYCQLDIEDVETGIILTKIPERKPQDFFHSRIEISPNHKYILSKGWYWHPFDGIALFDVEKCINDPQLLDSGLTPPEVTAEICSASFINNDELLICSSNEKPMDDELEDPIPRGHIAIWNIKTNVLQNPVKVQGAYGNIFAIDHNKCWDLFGHPKIINLENGAIIAEDSTVFSGHQNSSIIHHLEKLPKVVFNRKTKQVAIADGHKIEVLSV